MSETEQQPTIEEITDEEPPKLEDVPTLEDVEAGKVGESAAAAAARHRQTKAEKKNKKAIQKAGLKAFPGVKQVTIRSAQRLTLTIDDPEVYISESTGNTAVFIVFGKFNMEDPTQQRGQQAVQDLLSKTKSEVENDISELKPEETEQTTETEETQEELPENITEKDVQMVVEQTGLSRNEAIRRIKQHNGDIIEAITSATNK
ncbi:hypothetical protein ABK040_008225 [Willaertia magna]